MRVATRDPDLALRLEAFAERTRTYLRFGFDRRAAARHVAGLAAAAAGPVLDVGTGKGTLALALAERGLNVVSVDPDGEEQALAAELAAEAGLAGRLRLVRADAERLPCADGVFAAVVSMDVLHHLGDPASSLREMARTLRPGGTVLLADFTEEGFELVSQVHRLEGREHPRTRSTVAQAEAFLAERGFEPAARTVAFLHEITMMTRPRPGG